MRATARRIELSQEDEIEMMQEWLRERGQEATAIDAHHAEGFQPMPGMLTAEGDGQASATPRTPRSTGSSSI